MSKYLSVAQVAKDFGTTERHVRDLTRDHGLPFVRLGRLIRIRTDDLAAWVSANRHGDES